MIRLALLISVILVLAFLTWKRACLKQDAIDNLLGNKVILQGDTLLIVNYSQWDSSYILSNGVEINEKILHEILIMD